MKFLIKNKLWFMGCGLALLVGLLVRLPDFGAIPGGLNRDEAALGYNAYSLFTTGHDEWGVRWPVSITSFGDQKLPGYVYTLIPLIAAFGLQPWVVRLPSLLAGLANIVLIGILAAQLRRAMATVSLKKDADNTIRLPQWLPTLAMLLMAISPWANHFSRIAYEAHLAMMFFLIGAVALWQAVISAPKQQRGWLILSAAGWSASLLTYHAYHIFIPLMVLATGWWLRKWLRTADRIGLITGFIIALSTIGLMWGGGVWKANQVKIAGISPFADTAIIPAMATFRSTLPGGNTLFAKIMVNPWIERGSVFVRNLIDTTASSFYFTSTTQHHIHNVTGIGNLHLFLVPFIILGIIWLWNQRRTHPLAPWLASWLLIALIAPALTISPQHTIRISPLFPLLEMLGALGRWVAWHSLPASQLVRRLSAILCLVIVLFSTLRMELRYLYLVPKVDAQYSQLRYHHLAQLLIKYSATAIPIITNEPSSSPYIWYLLATKFDANQLQSARVTYPADAEGFQHVRSINNIEFINFDWPALEKRAQTTPLIVITQSRFVPGDKTTNPLYHQLEKTNDQFGTPEYEVWSLHR
jgi:4-amino-4-deoxy-L-arabinose transferase-like glycosyltransferase